MASEKSQPKIISAVLTVEEKHYTGCLDCHILEREHMERKKKI